ncbi:MAG: hypothetical protein JWM93_1665 [Frankiales bacterium]|nr:hypothetical protein [Frankiales bacterium]
MGGALRACGQRRSVETRVRCTTNPLKRATRGRRATCRVVRRAIARRAGRAVSCAPGCERRRRLRRAPRRRPPAGSTRRLCRGGARREPACRNGDRVVRRLRIQRSGGPETKLATRPATAAGSDSDVVTALAAARVEDRAAGASAHAQPEAVDLRTTAVVGLKGALAHWRTPGTTSATPTGRPQRPSHGTGGCQCGQTMVSRCRRAGPPQRRVHNHNSGHFWGCLAVVGVALLAFGPPPPLPSPTVRRGLPARLTGWSSFPSVHRLWMTVWMTR